MEDEGVPYLRVGKGGRPQDGGCILQVIDWIDRGEWTDTPNCVLPAFREMAINANDSLDDNERQKLLDLAPRMRGTAYAPLRDPRSGNIITPLTEEQLKYNREANLWMLSWGESHHAGDRHAEYKYDYLQRLRDALDVFEEKFGKLRPAPFGEIDWMPIYNYLRQFELNGEMDSQDVERITEIRISEHA